MDPVVGAVRAVHDFIGGTQALGDAVAEVARHGVQAVGGDMGGLTWRDAGGTWSTLGPTEAIVVEVDGAQYRTGRGPCLDALREGRVQVVEDTASPPAWPEFCEAAASRGLRSSLSVPVAVSGRSVAALNVYGRRAAQFDDDAVEVASLFAGQAAVIAALDDALRLADQLTRALESRAVIEQAKGIIMASTGCDADAAFEALREQSQAENRKLRVIALELVDQRRRRTTVRGRPHRGRP